MLFYIHGFTSSRQSRSCKLLNEIPGLRVEPLGYDSAHTCDQCLDELEQQIAELNPQDPCLFMGSSLGGFFSLLLASRHGGGFAMFNPCLMPETLLMYMLGENTYCWTGEKFILTKEAVESYAPYAVPLRAKAESLGLPHFIAVSEKDELIKDNVSCVRALFPRDSNILITQTTHDIDNYTPFAPYLIKLKEEIGA